MMFVFDVDGTLTPSRKEMDPSFKWWFQEAVQNYCFVTGSDKDKTVEQVGLDMFIGAKYSFNCNGNDVHFMVGKFTLTIGPYPHLQDHG